MPADERDDLWPVRFTLCFGIITGLLMAGFFLFIAEETPLAWDFIAYVGGAEAYLGGETYIGHTPEIGRGEYVYPPIVLLGFIPYALLGDLAIAYVIHSVINVALLSWLAWLCIGAIKRHRGSLHPLDTVLVGTFYLLGLYALIAIGLGQIDPLVALVIAGMFLAVESRRSSIAGTMLALAAVLKLFPAAFGIWLLKARDWRSVVMSWLVATGIGILSLIGFGLHAHLEYAHFLLHDRSRLDEFADGMSPDFFAVSLARPLSIMPLEITPITYAVVALLLVSPPLYVIYQRVDSPLDRYVAFLATIIAILIALPTTNINHLLYAFFPLLVVLYQLEPGRIRAVFLLGTVILLFPIQPGQVTSTLVAIGAPSVVVDTVSWVTVRIFATASVALIGSIVVLIGCLLYSIEDDQQATSVSQA